MGIILKCEKIKKEYKSFTLGSLSFSVAAGQIAGLIGANGAGKTTLLNILAGMDSQFEGQAWIHDMDVRKDPCGARNVLGVVSENIEFFQDKTVVENGEMLGELYERWEWEEYFLWMDRLDIPKDRFLYQFSKGENIKYQICFAMAHHPELLLLDEPTSGLDPVFRKSFRRILKDIAAQGTGILLSTHILDDLKEISDRIFVLDEGMLALEREVKNTDNLQQDTEIRKYLEKRISVRDLIEGIGKGA